MSGTDKRFQLRYVGSRFDGPRLPLDVLSDLPAFRELIVAFAKDTWRSKHNSKQRLPKGFDRSLSFDLVRIEEGSAMPLLAWRMDSDQTFLPGFTEELEDIVDDSFKQLAQLIDDVGRNQFPSALSSEYVSALNKLGSGLGEEEKIELIGSQGADGNVVFLDTQRRKSLITRVSQTYQKRFEGMGTLVGHHTTDNIVNVETSEYGELRIPLEKDRILGGFHEKSGQCVQFAVQIELDANDSCKRVVDTFKIEIVDPSIPDEIGRCQRRIEELRALTTGWLNGEGYPPSNEAMIAAESFLRSRPTFASLFRIFPTPEGGLAFEFETNGWDYSVEIEPTGSVQMYGIRIGSTDEMDPESFCAIDETFLKTFDSRTNS